MKSGGDAVSEAQPLVPKGSGDGQKGHGFLAVLASCVGFLADSYDLFTIDLVVLILELQYGPDVISAESKGLMVSTMLAGVVFGQLFFGLAADRFGRKWAFVCTAGLTVVSCLASALCGTSTVLGLPLQLAMCRFILGCGVGGEYPLSATVSAEAMVDGNSRGQVMALVVSMQGFGMLMASLLAMCLVKLELPLEVLWRVLLGFGALPSAVAFGLRWQLTESQVFRKAQSVQEVHGSRQKVLETVSACWKPLIGTCSAWLLMNVFTYSLGSFKSSIFQPSIHSPVAADQVLDQAFFAAVTSSFAILGFAAGMLLIRCTSRFLMQLGGFLALTAVFLAVSLLSWLWPSNSALFQLMVLGLVFFLLNSGPNLTTYILPAEIFPTSVRASCHGLSAASGKLGACLGTAAFPLVQRAYGMPSVYLACGVASALGALVTYALTPRLQVLELPDEHQPRRQGQTTG